MCLLQSAAFADRLIEIPIGRKIYIGTTKIGDQWNLRKAGDHKFSLRAPVLESYEIELEGIKRPGRDFRGTLGASYQLAVPIVDSVPGISIGVRDVANETPEGSAAYLTSTWLIGLNGDTVADTPANLTLGLGTGGLRGLFAGFMLPLAPQVRLIGEHDTHRLSMGFELRPVRDLQLQWVFRESETRLAAYWTLRF